MTHVFLLLNNWVGAQVFFYFLERTSTHITGIVLYPEGRQKRVADVERAARRHLIPVFYADELQHESTLKKISALPSDIAVSAYFGYLFKPELLDIFPQGVINIHPSLLPFNKGLNPSVWSIVDETPAGVTLHYIDKGIDTGDIICQQEVSVRPVDTGKTLYLKLEDTSIQLFKRNWPAIESGTIEPISQKPGEGSFHYGKELKTLDRIDLDKMYTARYLINLLRARTFPPQRGAYYEDSGKRIYLNLDLFEEDIQ
jgi:methionyl-tRNA formyltransferase